LTFAYKVVIPVATIATLAFGEIVAWRTNGVTFVSAIVAVPSLLFFAVFCLPLKKVVLEEDHLIVSNFVATISIPYSDVEQVDMSIWTSLRRTKIWLKADCRFGGVIVFVPPHIVYWGILTPHPDIELLRDRCKQHLRK